MINSPNVITDLRAGTAQPLIDVRQPPFELLKHRSQCRRGRLPFHEISLETLGKPLMSPTTYAFTLLNAEPVSQRLHVTQELRSRRWMIFVPPYLLQPIMRRLVHKGGGVGTIK